MTEIFLNFICVATAYLVGSISSAILVCRLAELPDPRTEGSKNPGATNVLRIGGKKYAIMVLMADLLKGLLPLLLAHALNLSSSAMAYTCLAAVAGHMYPVFFKFKGGKGVATALGAFLGFHFIMGSVAIATWLIVANFTRLSSLASIVAITLMPFYSLFVTGNLNAFYPLLLIAIFVLYQHRENISRLVVGMEPKINIKRSISTKTDTATKKKTTPKKSTKKVAKKGVKK